MCGCGRRRPQEVVTTAQVSAEAAARAENDQMLRTLEQQMLTAAEQLLQSAAKAVGNAHS